MLIMSPSIGASGGMADALASGASTRKGVGVQVPSRAHYCPKNGRISTFLLQAFDPHSANSSAISAVGTSIIQNPL